MSSPIRYSATEAEHDVLAAGLLMVEGFEEEALVHLTAIRRFALRLCGGELDEAEDVTQETYLRALRGWDGYERGTNCRAWLFTICRRVFLRRRNRHEREQFRSTDEWLPPVTTSTWTRSSAHGQATAQSRLESDRLLGDLDRLPPPFHAAARLRFISGLSYAEIAHELGIPVGTVKSRVHRGRLLLRKWHGVRPAAGNGDPPPGRSNGSNGGGTAGPSTA